MSQPEQTNNTRRATYKRDWETKPHRIHFTVSTKQADRIGAVIAQKGFTRNAFIRYAVERCLDEVGADL